MSYRYKAANELNKPQLPPLPVIDSILVSTSSRGRLYKILKNTSTDVKMTNFSDCSLWNISENL